MTALDIRTEDRVVELLEQGHAVQDAATAAGCTVAIVEQIARKWRLEPKGGGIREAAAVPAAPRPTPAPAPLHAVPAPPPPRPATDSLAVVLGLLTQATTAARSRSLARAATKAYDALAAFVRVQAELDAADQEAERSRLEREAVQAELERAQKALDEARERAKALKVKQPREPRAPRPEGAAWPGRKPTAKCGTQSGYKRHHREGTETCQPCKDAMAEENRRARERRKAATS